MLGGPHHPVIVAIRDSSDHIRVIFYSYYTTITGWGALIKYVIEGLGFRLKGFH